MSNLKAAGSILDNILGKGQFPFLKRKSGKRRAHHRRDCRLHSV